MKKKKVFKFEERIAKEVSKRKEEARTRAGSLLDYMLSVIADSKATIPRRDRFARILLPYLVMKRARLKPLRRDAGVKRKNKDEPEEVKEQPRGKKARRKEASKTAAEGTDWDKFI